LTSASFAAPSTGGAVSLILSPPSSILSISFFDARGWIRIESVAAAAAPLFRGGLFLGATAGLLEVDHFPVHLDDLLHVLQKMMPMAFQLQDFSIEPCLFLLGITEDLLTADVRVLDDQILPARCPSGPP
jgi:hypothetical protein